MISLILPYWDRQEAADIALKSLEKCYQGMDLEVIVIDDGNKIPFKVPDVNLNIRVLTLPRKDKAMSPVTPFNEGVKFSEGDYICLSCIEVIHVTPVLGKLLEEAEKGVYALASAWCPEENKWHCYSDLLVPTCPPGTGLSFCSMLNRFLYEKVGGFDEDYREGAGYEDRDFIWRLTKAGIKSVIRDDLMVIHPKTGAKINWEPEQFVRNEKLYHEKQVNQQRITFVCVKAGTAYGPEYVNILRDMVSRNLPEGYPGRFVCLTDDPTGIEEGIEIIPLPEDLYTWWGKLYMFKRGLFKDGERLFFLDLDTVIIGALDDVVSYNGKFATLKDFYFPSQLGPAIILWEAGDFAGTIWDEWVSTGKERHLGGDLWWLNNLDQGRFSKNVDILQHLYPKQFVSYKADCHPYPPKGARVVCFHGQPKPHNCQDDWVKHAWEIGGSGQFELSVIANTGRETVKRNVTSAISRGLAELEIIPPIHDKTAIIVGGGPSAIRTLHEIKYAVENGRTLVALNGSARWLNNYGLTPDIHIVIDARPENVRFILESTAKRRFLASQCDPSLFDACVEPLLFHMNTEGMEDILPKDKVAHLISSGSTVGLAAMAIMYTQGYRTIVLHGYDSSHEESRYAYPQPENEGDRIVEVVAGDRKFKAAPWMVKQVQQFQELVLQLNEGGMTVIVAGDGLLPHVAHLIGVH